MTDRQKRLLAAIRPRLSEVYKQAVEETRDKPSGWSVLCRVATSFGSWPAIIHLHVVKADDGFAFRVDEPLFWHRKGHAMPKWRRLHA